MKRIIIAGLCLLATATSMLAQDNTKNLTLYRQFKPATILMTNGKVVKTPLANIFLKDASLLYLKGENAMTAYMQTIRTVKIDSTWFDNIDNKLAQLIDSVGPNRLYCITEIDMEAYQAMLKNNVNITVSSFQELTSGSSDQLSYSTVELEAEEDHQLPLIRRYYYLYNGEIVRAHEREISRRLPKDKKHIYKSVMSLSDFSWVDPDSLMKMLKAISE